MDNVKEYIEERMSFYASKIDDFEIDESVKRKDNGKKCVITNKTKNSLEVYITKNSNDGINCKQWFTAKDFEKQFIKL